MARVANFNDLLVAVGVGVQSPVRINGELIKDADALQNLCTSFVGSVEVIINPKAKRPVQADKQAKVELAADVQYRIKVRQYMTRPATDDFPFHRKFNNDQPMPMRIMVGRKLEETRGMVKMELWGQMEQGLMTICMKCGRTLTNPISRYFGIGPECGGHHYVNPFDSEQELNAAIEDVQKQLADVRWTGWIIKSAIEEESLING